MKRKGKQVGTVRTAWVGGLMVDRNDILAFIGQAVAEGANIESIRDAIAQISPPLDLRCVGMVELHLLEES